MHFENRTSPASLAGEFARGGAGAQALLGLAAYLVLGALTLSPLLWAAVPPLVDYPNHLARMWILVHGAEIPALASNYVAHWRLIPNLAMDLVVPALAQLMPVELAGRVFIALTMVLLVAGTAALHRVLHGRVGLWPLCSLLFIYNAAMYWGLLNFLFGAGVFLLAFSGWIATRSWPISWRLLAFSLAASVLFILHLFAFGLYGLSVMSYELGSRLKERWSVRSLVSWCLVGAQFLPAGLLFVASLAQAGPTYTAYGDLDSKLYALRAPVTFGTAANNVDRATLVFCCAFAAFGIRRRWLKLAPEMRLPLVALVLAAALMPEWLSSSWAADIRLPVMLPFIVVAGTRVEISRRWAVSLFAAVAVTLLAARVVAVSQSWRDDDRRFAEFRAASEVITPGARLLIFEAPIETAAREPPVPLDAYRNMPALAVIDRGAFIPYLFTGWTPISPAPRNEGRYQGIGLPAMTETLAHSVTPEGIALCNRVRTIYGERAYWCDWPNRFDFVLWIDFGRGATPALKELRPLAGGSFFEIFRVVPP